MWQVLKDQTHVNKSSLESSILFKIVMGFGEPNLESHCINLSGPSPSHLTYLSNFISHLSLLIYLPLFPPPLPCPSLTSDSQAPQIGCTPRFHCPFECPLSYPFQLSNHSLTTKFSKNFPHYSRNWVTPSSEPQGLCADWFWEIILRKTVYTSVFPSMLQGTQGKLQSSSPLTH